MGPRFTKNFSVAELACKDGTPVPQALYANAKAIAERAQKLRDLVGPLSVNSAYRTKQHNDTVGGAKESYHLTASAMDVRSTGGVWTAHQLYLLYEGLIRLGVVPDGGLGRYKEFIHIDIGPARRWEG